MSDKVKQEALCKNLYAGANSKLLKIIIVIFS